MMQMNKTLCLVFLTLILGGAFIPIDAKTIYIRIDRPSRDPFPIAVLPTPENDPENINLDIMIQLKRALEFTNYFRILPSSAYIDEDTGASFDTSAFDFTNWLSINALALIKTVYEVSGGTITLKAGLYDPLREKRLIYFEEKTKKERLSDLVHAFLDQVLEELTGERGVFSTRVAYIYKDRRKRHFLKNISIFGRDDKTIFRSKRQFMLSPEWSFNGDALYITKDTRNSAQVFKFSLKKNKLTRFTRLNGTVVAPAVCRAKPKIAVSVTKGAKSKIVLLNKRGKITKTLASSVRLNVSPSFSPDCGHMVFASGRSGGLHIFTQPTDSMLAIRRTFQGALNDNPTWSPRGDKILFSGMDRDGEFDIFVMGPEGEDLTRLTYDARNNESPSWSPDGRHVVFSSNRTGRYQLWIMRADGTHQRQLTFYPRGNAITPSWSPRFKN